ncbi:hypothetical protein PGT21_025048 [Puccinia graminis f. sp. tritici]|uniref:Uncharacterized protein n=1 Tax=Puccinia graminis f. sp. tritici TaxID=56615 RepID=A0A5B0N7B4_PUCGR|nr:hypothetical protein PGT21_025048 [Puccinia graminis f. sp. tritici]
MYDHQLVDKDPAWTPRHHHHHHQLQQRNHATQSIDFADTAERQRNIGSMHPLRYGRCIDFWAAWHPRLISAKRGFVPTPAKFDICQAEVGRVPCGLYNRPRVL